MKRLVAYALLALALTAPVMVGTARAAGGNADAGAADFKRTCGICHTAEAGKNKIGPSLFAVVGRAAGTAPGFNYSDAMKGSGLTWTPENLEKYIADPKGTVPGNKMAYPGIKDATQRQDIIAYLATLH
jgi:cytochrome c